MPSLGPEGSRHAPGSAEAPRGGFAFGPYRLETQPKRLLRSGTPVNLSPRQLDLLHQLVANADKVLPKRILLDTVWHDTSVGDNSLERMVSDLRSVLDDDDRGRYIRNIARRGYQFVAAVAPIDCARVDVDVYALLAPDRAWGDGLAALETLEHGQLLRAGGALEQLVAQHPREARFRVGLALTNALLYEGTRTDPHPDVATLERAEVEAHEACRLSPGVAESWATLGFVLERTGDRENALAALRRATRLDKHNWLHHLRLAMGSWGQERLSAVRDTLALNHGFAIAHLLAAQVWVAREVIDEAVRELDTGIAAMEAEANAPPRYTAIALHYVRGLLYLSQGALAEALTSFDREIAVESRGHLYGRECCANAWYAKGVCCLALGDPTAAKAAYLEATTRIPDHAMARAGLAILDGPHSDAAKSLTADPSRSFEVVMARAAGLVAAGDTPGAVIVVATALAPAPPGSTGWLIPIEPMLRVWEHREAWAPVLAMLHLRAR